MRAIWKFPLPVEDSAAIRMPVDAQVLCVQVQHGTTCLWAIVSTDAALVLRTFRVYGTGHEHESIPGRYVGTFQLSGGALVFHVFEETS